MLVRQFTGMLIYILVAAAAISGALGEWVDFFAIIIILIVNGVIGFVQEWKARASIQALKKMASSEAAIIRDGKHLKVAAEELVPGDILIVSTGDKIPADARLIESVNLEAVEGALTGESTPVSKHIEPLEGKQAVGDQKNMVFSGTIISKGRGKAVITSTGMKTEIGHIAHLIQQAETDETPLQKNLDVLGGRIGKVTIGVCAGIFLLVLFLTEAGVSLDAVKHAFLLSVSLAVAAVPEGLPIVVTIALAFGTQRMVKRHALIKRLPAVETLGSTTVICTDKTGTLTRNEMTVTSIWHAGKSIEVTGAGYKADGEIKGEAPGILYETCVLCNDANLTPDYRVVGDPTEGCLLTLAEKAGYQEEETEGKHPRLAEVPFDSRRKRMSTVHNFDGQRLLLCKGAPDIILEQCSKIREGEKEREITEKDRKAILKANETYAKQALRVLGFAYKPVEEKKEYGEADENELVFVALTGMIDPPREEARAAVATAKAAGIRVIMITGDHRITAQAIAEQIGITGKAVEGKDLENIDLAKEVDNISVFARVNPEHKMAIIDALKKNGEVVAMTGDGVNDAPALKRADIGVAMGITGTDVAKESASMILTDDNFASIVAAIEEGRNIFTNIKKFVNYLLSSNLAEVLVIFFSVLLFRADGVPIEALTIPMLLFINLLTDSLPALALGVDPGDPKAMQKKPRDPQEGIITKNMGINIIFIGILVTVAVLAAFWYTLERTGSVEHARTVALTTIVALEIVRLAMVRQQYRTPAFSNKWLFIAIAVVFVLQLAVIYVPFFQYVFDTVALGLLDWGLIVATGIATYVVGLLIGRLVRRMTGQRD